METCHSHTSRGWRHPIRLNAKVTSSPADRPRVHRQTVSNDRDPEEILIIILVTTHAMTSRRCNEGAMRTARWHSSRSRLRQSRDVRRPQRRRSENGGVSSRKSRDDSAGNDVAHRSGAGDRGWCPAERQLQAVAYRQDDSAPRHLRAFDSSLAELVMWRTNTELQARRYQASRSGCQPIRRSAASGRYADTGNSVISESPCGTAADQWWRDSTGAGNGRRRRAQTQHYRRDGLTRHRQAMLHADHAIVLSILQPHRRRLKPASRQAMNRLLRRRMQAGVGGDDERITQSARLGLSRSSDADCPPPPRTAYLADVREDLPSPVIERRSSSVASSLAASPLSGDELAPAFIA